MEKQMSLKDKLAGFLSEPHHLKEIYEEFPEEKPTTIRGRLNENIGKCFKRISEGFYLAERGDAKAIIVEGDSWEKIKDIEDGVIDTIITDSPYSCLNKHYNIGTTRQRNRDKNIGFETKDIDKVLLKEMWRVLKPNGHFFCFLPSDAKDTLDYNEKMIREVMSSGFEFNKRWIWDKKVMSMGYNGRNIYEQVLFFSKGKRRFPYDLSITDILHHKKPMGNKRLHVAEKPVELIEDIMKFSNKEGDVVLDPFAGSLSVAEAGLRRKVNTISIELDGDMIKRALSARRMENVIQS